VCGVAVAGLGPRAGILSDCEREPVIETGDREFGRSAFGKTRRDFRDDSTQNQGSCSGIGITHANFHFSAEGE
jgi:hypothetical protein